MDFIQGDPLRIDVPHDSPQFMNAMDKFTVSKGAENK